MESLITYILKIVFSFLDVNDLFFASGVCKRWFAIVYDNDNPPPILLKQLTNHCAQYSYNSCLKWLRYRYPAEWIWNWGRLATFAARGGNLELLKTRKQCSRSICQLAVVGGHLHVLKWALQQQATPTNASMTEAAAEAGHLDILRYLIDMGFPWTWEIIKYAAANGDLDMIKFAREHGCPWNESCCEVAITEGKAEVFHWLRENGCPFKKFPYTTHLELLQWAKTNNYQFEHFSKWAVEKNSLVALKWLQENNLFEPSELLCADAAQNGNLDMLKWLRANGCSWQSQTIVCAAYRGHLGIIQWAISNECPVDFAKTIKVAALYCHLNVLQWFAEDPDFVMPILGYKDYSEIVQRGSLQVLKWIRLEGSPWTLDTVTTLNVPKQIKPGYGEAELTAWFEFFDYATTLANKAAGAGHFQIVKWLYEQGAKLEPKLCDKAARKGYLHIIKWARANGCIWPQKMLGPHAKLVNKLRQERWCPVNSQSVKLDHLELFDWAKANGCPWDGKLPCLEAEDVLVYAIEQGCTGDFTKMIDFGEPVENKQSYMYEDIEDEVLEDEKIAFSDDEDEFNMVEEEEVYYFSE